MFTNIGSKIKKLAIVVCWIGIVFGVVSGIIEILAGGSQNILTGIVTMLIYPLFSWLGSFLVYGFGELIETNQQIRDVTCGKGSDN